LRHCIFCRHEVDVVLWVFDGVSDYPVPACRSCVEQRRLKVFRIEPGEGRDLPDQASCECCGRALPSPDTWPVIVWVEGKHGLVAVCNACRLEYALNTVFTTLPHGEAQPPPRAEAEPPSCTEAEPPPLPE
jgi:hypothetical protein